MPSKKKNVTMITNSTQRSVPFNWMCVSSYWCGTLFSVEVPVILVATKEKVKHPQCPKQENLMLTLTVNIVNCLECTFTVEMPPILPKTS